jgi:hypothetical protein
LKPRTGPDMTDPMKKTKMKRIGLRKESVRLLQASQIVQIAGGKISCIEFASCDVSPVSTIVKISGGELC